MRVPRVSSLPPPWAPTSGNDRRPTARLAWPRWSGPSGAAPAARRSSASASSSCVALAAAFGLSRLIGAGRRRHGRRVGHLAPADAHVPETTVPGDITGETPCPAADGSTRTGDHLREPAAHVHRPGQDLHRDDRHQRGQLHGRPRRHEGAADGQQLRRAVPLPLLRRVDVPPDRAQLRGAGRRSARHRRGGPGYEFDDELPASLEDYTAGSLAMANSGPDTNGSQFFVTLADTGLDGPNYSLFGQVTEGFDTTVKALEPPAEGRHGPRPSPASPSRSREPEPCPEGEGVESTWEPARWTTASPWLFQPSGPRRTAAPVASVTTGNGQAEAQRAVQAVVRPRLSRRHDGHGTGQPEAEREGPAARVGHRVAQRHGRRARARPRRPRRPAPSTSASHSGVSLSTDRRCIGESPTR